MPKIDPYRFLDHFNDHRDSAARAFCFTHPTAFAIVILELKALTRSKLGDGVIRADSITVITFKTVTAGHAASGFVFGTIQV